MCDCRKRIEANLLESMQRQYPEGKDISVSLDGYAFMFGGPEGVKMKNFMPVAVEYKAPPPKKGVIETVWKQKKQTLRMMGSYCMFCGEKYPEPEQEAGDE